MEILGRCNPNSNIVISNGGDYDFSLYNVQTPPTKEHSGDVVLYFEE